jgi:hypothetical protein
MYAEVSFRGLFVAFFGGREEKKKKKNIPKGNRHKVRHSIYTEEDPLWLWAICGVFSFCVWVCWFPGARHFAPRPHPLLFGLDIGV